MFSWSLCLWALLAIGYAQACTVRPLSEIKTLLFERHASTVTCKPDTVPDPALVCHQRCGYERKVSPILCENLDFGTNVPSPNWKCSTHYKFDEGYSLQVEKVSCERSEDDQAAAVVVGSCHLEYRIKHEDDDKTWTQKLLEWIVWIIFWLIIILCIIVVDRKPSSSGSSFSYISIGNRSGGGGGGLSSSFAGTSLS
jgi:hypothetical protein